MKKDQTMPEGPWEFDQGVTEAFDDMLTRSIPNIEDMRRGVTALATSFLPEGGMVLDIGCSRGSALAHVIEKRPDVSAIGVEISKPMIDAARDRFADKHNVTIIEHDLRDGLPDVYADVTLSILTLQFTPLEYRQSIMAAIQERTSRALILVEKVLGATREIDDAMVDAYHDMKRQHGYTDEAIERKRLSLEGVLVPATAAWNEDLIRSAGWQSVDAFWRWMNFAGWIALSRHPI